MARAECEGDGGGRGGGGFHGGEVGLDALDCRARISARPYPPWKDGRPPPPLAIALQPVTRNKRNAATHSPSKMTSWLRIVARPTPRLPLRSLLCRPPYTRHPSLSTRKRMLCTWHRKLGAPLETQTHKARSPVSSPRDIPIAIIIIVLALHLTISAISPARADCTPSITRLPHAGQGGR